MDRNQKIIRTSYIGIAVNLAMVLVKAVIGLMTHSIAILLDAVNNLGDALSSVITIVGTKLSGKTPDKKHPYGYGRVEYLTSVIIAAIVLTAGTTSLRESVGAVLHPEPASYTPASLVIIAIAVVVKFLSGRYVKAVGEKLNAQSLVASGSEAFFDAVLSAATLVAALVSMFWGISLEGFLGLVISVLLIKAGLEILLETLEEIIGSRADRELTLNIKKRVASFPGVRGAYDLVLHNYGPSQMIGTVHVEVDDTATAKELHKLSHRIITAIEEEYGLLLTVGFYAANTTEDEALVMKEEVREVVHSYPEIISFHGFYADVEESRMSFDVVMNFKVDAEGVRDRLREQLEKKYSGWHVGINIDTDYSD